MEKFRFFKKNLQTKGLKIAKTSQLDPLLKTPDRQLTWTVFKEGLEEATNSKHATDKILAMMKSYSMISTNKLAPGDDKQTTHIKFPLKNHDKTKIETIPLSYGWKTTDTTTITNFINSYNDIGKLAKAKISWVITKMHNPKELAQLALKTEKRSRTRKKEREVQACLNFLLDARIHRLSPLIASVQTQDPEHPFTYTLNVSKFNSLLKQYTVQIPDNFRSDLDKYQKSPGTLLPDTFNEGLPDHGDKKIQQYNKTLRDLLTKGTIDNKYPTHATIASPNTNPNHAYENRPQILQMALNNQIKALLDVFKNNEPAFPNYKLNIPNDQNSDHTRHSYVHSNAPAQYPEDEIYAYTPQSSKTATATKDAVSYLINIYSSYGVTIPMSQHDLIHLFYLLLPLLSSNNYITYHSYINKYRKRLSEELYTCLTIMCSH